MSRRFWKLFAVYLLTLTLAAAFGAWFVYPYVPGTLHKGTDGNWRGTGTHADFYRREGLPVEQWPAARRQEYVAGKMVYQCWYHPDGHMLAEEDWRDDQGVAWDFHTDGSLHFTMEAKDGVAHGAWTHYNPDGTVLKVEDYRHGKRVTVSP